MTTDSQFSLFGHDLLGKPIKYSKSKLYDEFLYPPFTVLDARSGVWQERKRAWIGLGIESELGRAPGCLASTKLSSSAHIKYSLASKFDPALCEVLYKWFCPFGGQIIDPFAGGSVRGIVASCLVFTIGGGICLRCKSLKTGSKQ